MTTQDANTRTDKRTPIMPLHQQREVWAMDAGEICDFQIRLQIECGMSHDESADYVAQAFEGDAHECTSTTTPDGHCAYCADCGAILA